MGAKRPPCRRCLLSDDVNRAAYATIADYMHATALEAVVGYLYAAGDKARLDEIMRRAMEESV